MKILIFILLNFSCIFGFFVFTQQKNKELTQQLLAIDQAIESKSAIWIAAENFKQQRQALEEQIERVVVLEQEKIKTLDFLYDFVNQVPQAISIFELSKKQDKLMVTGKADSQSILNGFLNKNNLKLMNQKRLSFEASGKT